MDGKSICQMKWNSHIKFHHIRRDFHEIIYVLLKLICWPIFNLQLIKRVHYSEQFLIQGTSNNLKNASKIQDPLLLCDWNFKDFHIELYLHSCGQCSVATVGHSHRIIISGYASQKPIGCVVGSGRALSPFFFRLPSGHCIQSAGSKAQQLTVIDCFGTNAENWNLLIAVGGEGKTREQLG